MANISPRAVVANPAGLAEDVTVGPFCCLGPEVSVGPGTVIDNNVTVAGRTSIGGSCRLLPGCVVGASAPGSAGPGRCTVADRNTIREHVTIYAGSDAGTVIGPDNLLMIGCHVGHDAVLAGAGIFANFTGIDHHARIEKFVQTSGFCEIAPYATVGAYTFTTGYAGIDRDAPPYAIVQGFPFRVRNVNVEKLKRCGFAAGSIDTLKGAFRMLFNGRKPSPDPDLLCRAEETFDDECVRHLIACLRRSAASPTGRCLQPASGQAPCP